MKLLYLTNVQIPADDAQNLQIQSMCKVFYNYLKDDFLLISPLNSRNKNFNSIYQWKRIKIFRKFSRELKQIIFLLKTIFLVKKFQPDIIYTRDVVVSWFYKKLGYQTVYEIHNPFETKIGNFIFKLIAPKIKIVATHNALKDFIINKYNLNFKNILVARNGVFLEDYEKIKEKREALKEKYLGLGGGDFVVMYSGNFQEGKGIELIFEAATQLPKILFAIIGGSEEEIKKMSGAPKNILFLGRKLQEEIPSYLKVADLLVLPMNKLLSYSHFSSPLKLFEYMASQNPILASDIGAITEVLNEQNSFLFDSDKKGDFKEKIIYIRNNTIEAQIRAKKASDDIKNYTWEKRVEKILNFLK
jgi:glycosyltransferase involved in cell wall biosynthesis